MNIFFVMAAGLAFLVGLIHSALGERLIFRRLREGGLIPTNGGRLLHESHVRIIWASWHVLTIFGWGFAAILLWLALRPNGAPNAGLSEIVIAISMLIGAVFVFIGTKAKHPGWIGLLGVAMLVALGSAG